jgi:hypothetical protein
VGPEEVQAAEDLQEIPSALETDHDGLSVVLRSLEMGPFDLVIRAIGAR